MKINESENVFYTDIDDTLCLYKQPRNQEPIEFNYYGEKKYLYEHKPHTSFLRALKTRGYHITAWSANGSKWAYEVCTKLGLSDIIDECKTKPTRILDDCSFNKWCKTIYIPHE